MPEAVQSQDLASDSAVPNCFHSTRPVRLQGDWDRPGERNRGSRKLRRRDSVLSAFLLSSIRILHKDDLKEGLCC